MAASSISTATCKRRPISARGVDLSYQSGSRALAVLNRNVRKLEIDGQQATPVMLGENVLALPRGQHLVSIDMD